MVLKVQHSAYLNLTESLSGSRLLHLILVDLFANIIGAITDKQEV